MREWEIVLHGTGDVPKIDGEITVHRQGDITVLTGCWSQDTLLDLVIQRLGSTGMTVDSLRRLN